MTYIFKHFLMTCYSKRCVTTGRWKPSHVSCLSLWEKSCCVTPLLDILPTHNLPLKAEWRGVGHKVLNEFFGIWSGLGIEGRRAYTCQQRCQPSSSCRKCVMIGARPIIGMFSHRGCCLGRVSRLFLMTPVFRQPCLRGTEEQLGQMVHQDTNGRRWRKNRSEERLALPCSNQYPAISHSEEKKNLVTDNPSFCDCLTMNY